MDLLPNEILLKIFQKLSVEDLQASSTISTRWHFLITTDITLVQKLPLVLTKKIASADVFEAILASNHIDYENLIIQYMKESFFKIIEKYQESVKNLKIWITDGEMDFTTALRIFTMLKNIERVQIYYTKLNVDKSPEHYNAFMSKVVTPVLPRLIWVEFLDSDFLFFKIMEKSKITYLDYNASYGARLIRFLFDQNELKTLILWRNIFSEIELATSIMFQLDNLIIYANNLNYDRKFLNFLTTQKSLKKIVYASHDHDLYDRNCFRVILNDMENLQEVYLNINNVDFNDVPAPAAVAVPPGVPPIDPPENAEGVVLAEAAAPIPEEQNPRVAVADPLLRGLVRQPFPQRVLNLPNIENPNVLRDPFRNRPLINEEVADNNDDDLADIMVHRRMHLQENPPILINHNRYDDQEVIVVNNNNIQQLIEDVRNPALNAHYGLRENFRRRGNGARVVVELRGRRLIHNQLQNLNMILHMNNAQQNQINVQPPAPPDIPRPIFQNQINTNTQKLTLYGKNDQEIVRNIIRIFPNLVTLNLLKAGNIDDDFMLFLAGYLDCLENICIETSDDVVWSDGIKFKDLKTVHIQTYQMRPESLNSFFSCNKGIEQLMIDRCCRLDDANFETIAKNLPKLKHLEIIGANNLTRHFFKLIRKHCSQLNFLKIQRKSFQAFEKSDLNCLNEILGLRFYYRTED